MTLALCLTITAFCCNNKENKSSADISIEAFSGLRTPIFSLDDEEILNGILYQCHSDTARFSGNGYARKYYLEGGKCLWVSRFGVCPQADTLLTAINRVGDVGLSPSAFGAKEIEADIRRVRTLAFDNGTNSINNVLARLEYRLTAAYLCYAIGMRFGFVNPNVVLNRIDTVETDGDTQTKIYKKLFDLKVERPNAEYVARTIGLIAKGAVSDALKAEPADVSLYNALAKLLKSTDEENRMKVLCNMERCRWHWAKDSSGAEKKVVVNVPAFHLYGFGPTSSIDMKVVCGSKSNKTPLLASCIMRMDFNPVWNIPASIVKKEIMPHANDTSYFSRNHYYVVERSSGERVAMSEINAEILSSGDFRVVQDGGEWNSLGRVVFRFPNDFSVFLHDTPNRGTFSRETRNTSHGCIRVEKPWDLAMFLLGDIDEWEQDKIRISMDMQPSTIRGKRLVEDSDDKLLRLVKSKAVEPCVQLNIVYYTIYPDAKGQLSAYPDIYGYDAIIYENIKPLVD